MHALTLVEHKNSMLGTSTAALLGEAAAPGGPGQCAAGIQGRGEEEEDWLL